MTVLAKSCASLLAAAMLSAAALAQNDIHVRDQEPIARVKNTLISQLEAGMPKITLEYFLKSEAGSDAKLTWEVNDCGEQTGDPATSGRDIPICVQAEATLTDGRVVSVMVAIGSTSAGTKARPQLFSVFVSGARQPVTRLSQIPLEMHREFPKRQGPRDIPGVLSGPGAA